MAVGDCKINMRVLLPIANYPQFILNHYQEVGQKPSHIATTNKTYNKIMRYKCTLLGHEAKLSTCICIIE